MPYWQKQARHSSFRLSILGLGTCLRFRAEETSAHTPLEFSNRRGRKRSSNRHRIVLALPKATEAPSLSMAPLCQNYRDSFHSQSYPISGSPSRPLSLCLETLPQGNSLRRDRTLSLQRISLSRTAEALWRNGTGPVCSRFRTNSKSIVSLALWSPPQSSSLLPQRSYHLLRPRHWPCFWRLAMLFLSRSAHRYFAECPALDLIWME